MQFITKVNPIDSPDEVGEMLRREFFKEEYSNYEGRKYRKLGCYSTFAIAPGVLQLVDEPIDPCYPSDGMQHVFEKKIDGQRVTMKYYWDGDGDLTFYFEDGSCLSNGDCKKTYGWTYYDSSKDLTTANEI